MLTLNLLGKFEVRRDDHALDLPLRAAQSLLAYLALTAGTPHRREQLAGLFWPDRPEASAKSNLRQTLSRLRKAIGEGYLVADDLTLEFEPTADYWLDAREIERPVAAHTTADDLIASLAVYGGELLPGFYDEWVLLERERLQAAFEHKMGLLLERLVAAQRWADVVQWGEHWLALGHTPEAAYRALIRAHGARGDVASAAAVYQRGVAALQRDLGVEPSPQTRAVFEQVKRAPPVPIDGALPPRPRTNLPMPLTSFIGRELALAEVRRLITTRRAVTLLGAGGAGKTRLALEAAAALVETFADGVWLIELAPLSDATLIPNAVAATLGLQVTSGRPIVTALIDVLREKHRLLIFDNCEHVIDVSAQLAAALLQACPRLHILATSREALNLAGEVAWPIPALSTPAVHEPVTASDAARSEAVRLFVERGAAVIPAYALTAGNVAAITRICQRLDGLPLALELAAARLKILSADEIAERLDDRFHLLTGGQRTALPHQQTLRATLDWSYHLLSRPEQVLLQGLSVFAGSWTLAAAERVCGDQAGESVLDRLMQLANKSLVNVEPALERDTRYRMPETIRHYAREKLIESGEEPTLRQRHLDYYRHLANRARSELRRSDQLAWFRQLEAEIDNLRTALDWSLGTDVPAGLQLMTDLRWFWYSGIHADDAYVWLSRLLQTPASQSSTARLIRAEALAVQSQQLFLKGQLPLAQQHAEESLALCGALGDERVAALALMALGRVVAIQGHMAQACQYHEQSLALIRAQNDPVHLAEGLLWRSHAESDRRRHAELAAEAQAVFRAQGDWIGMSFALIDLGRVAVWEGDFPLAQRWLDDIKDLLRQAGHLGRIRALHIDLLGRAAFWAGDYDRARIVLEEGAQLLWDTGYVLGYFWALALLGHLAVRQHDPPRARANWTKCLSHFREAHTPIGVVFCVEGLASLAVQQQRPGQAARLLAWADQMRATLDDSRPRSEQVYVDQDLAVIHTQLDEATFQAEQAAGCKLTLDDAIACALEASEP